jgi:hypothetical protein
MAAPASQDFKTHRRFDPAWHFVGIILLLLGVIAAAVHAYKHPGMYNFWLIAYAFGILLVAGRARRQTLTVQDRLIRLEMRLRLKDLLPAALAARIGELTPSQLVGLRFAGDAELPALVERCLSGQLTGGEAVKKEIKNWQPDWLRA